MVNGKYLYSVCIKDWGKGEKEVKGGQVKAVLEIYEGKEYKHVSVGL